MTGTKCAGSIALRAPARLLLPFRPIRRVAIVAGASIALLFCAATAGAATFTWNRVSGGTWTTSTNWTPTRSAPASTDILVFDGAVTSSPSPTSVPTQTIQQLRVINNSNVTLSAAATVTLTLIGTTGTDLDILAGSTLNLSGASPISISLTSGVTANIAGNMTVAGGAHTLVGATAGSIVFAGASNFTTNTGFTGSAFGSTGTANIVTFASGSTYIHNAGSNPFGLAVPSSKIVFQPGSNATLRTATNFSGDGRTYANLRLQNNTVISSTGSSNFQMQTLTIESGSSFTRTATGSAITTLTGDITTAGTGAVSLTAPGGIVFSGGTTQTIGGGGGTGTITLNSITSIASGTTVALVRTLTFGAGIVTTVNGTFQLNQGGAVSGGGNFVYGSGGRLVFNNTSGSMAVASTSTFWPSTSSPTTVVVQGAGGITMNTARTVSTLFQTNAAVVNGNQLTLSGTVQMDASGSFSSAPIYSGTPTLVYSAAHTVGNEWTAGTVVGSGVPRNVTLQAGAGTIAMPTTDRTVVGNLLITTGTLALNVTSGNLFVGGDWTNTGTFTPNGRTVTFNGGTATQTITRTGGETFTALSVDKTGGSVVMAASPATNVTVNGITGDVLTLNNLGTLNIGANTLTLSGNGGNLRASGTGSGTMTITGTGTVSITGTKTVTATAGRTLVFDTSLRVLTSAAVNFGASLTTIRGIHEIVSGGSVSTSAPTYQAGATLRYNTGGTVGRGLEWSAISGPGYPSNVEVQTGTLNLGNGGTSTARQIASNLVVQSGATLTMDTAGSQMTARLTVLGNITVAGTLTLSALSGGDLALAGNLGVTGTFNATQAVHFQGAVVQTASAPSTLTLTSLRLNKSAGSLQLLSNVTLTAPTGDALQYNGTNDVLDLNGKTFTLTSTLGGTNAAGAMKGSATSDLIVNGTGALGTLRFVAGSEQLGNLTINRTSSGSVTLGSPLTVNGVLALNTATVVTGANTLTLGTSGSLTRTSGYVNGNLKKRVTTGAPSLAFEIGTASGYTPVSLLFGSVTVAGDLTATSNNGDHANIATSGIITNKSVNRWFNLVNAGTVFDTCNVTFNFLAGDVDAGSATANFEAHRFVSPTWFGTGPGLANATSTRANKVTAFGQFAIGELVLHNITSSSGPDGTISPLGSFAVRDRHDVTYSFIPDGSWIHVTDVVVDGVSEGVLPSYTFTEVTADHTITVTYAVNRYPIAIVINGQGTVTKDPDQPNYMHSDTVTLTATAALGWDFVNWTGDVTGVANPLPVAMYGNYVVTANFARRSAGYNRTVLSGAYTSLTVGGGATQLIGAGDDSTKSIPMPFPFTFTGLPFSTSNFLAVNANGFVFPSRASVSAAVATQSNNANLFASIFPNGTIAPWYDNLSLNTIGTNPNGQILYRTQGAVGSRTLTVQWTNVSSFNSVAGGQPRQLNFQAVLFEGTNEIEFRYGPVLGSSASTLESASIGIEDSLGGNNNYIDGATGSRTTNHGMLTSSKWPARFIHFAPTVPVPLAAGTYDVGAGKPYGNLSDAVADLNSRGVAGPVTLRLTDAVYDTSASGGRNIFPIVISRIPGTSASNTVTIQPAVGTATLAYRGTESGFCGNQLLTTAITTANEPILALVGADYVTLRNLNLVGGSAVDRGLMLLQSSTSDGTQNNTFENVSISLDRSNNSSIGLQQISPSTPNDASGTNFGNHYYNLSISNVYAGISLAGHASIPDVGSEIGVSGAGTSVIGGASPNDIGNGPTQTFGIRATNQAGIRIFGSEVRNITGTSTSTVDGILLEDAGAATYSSGTCEIFANRVHDLQSTSTSAGVVSGIRASLSSHPSSVSRIYNNFVYGLNSASTSTISRRILGLSIQDGGGGSGATHQIDYNSVRISPTNVTAPNAALEIGTVSGPVMKVRNNVLANFVGTQSGSGKHYCWITPGPTVGPAGSISDHNVLHINNTANGYIGSTTAGDHPTLLSWQSSTGNDNNSSSANPQYISDTNIHIKTTAPTPVESRASTFSGTIPWAAADIDGDARNASTPDVGADEGTFIILRLNDIGAAGIVDPVQGATKFVNTAFTPKASFENAGTVDQLNVPVRVRIKGPNPSTAIVYDRTAVADTIVSGATRTVSFPSATIAAAGQYTVEAVAELGSDLNHANDLITGTFDLVGPLNGTYTIGTSQAAPFNSLTNAVARLNTVGVSGPVTMLLSDPLYSSGETFPIIVQPYPGNGVAAPVTLRPAPGVLSTITASNTRAIVVLDGPDYFTIDGSNFPGGTSRDLTINNSNTSPGSAVVWGETTVGGNPLRNCTIRNLAVNGNAGTTTLAGIGLGGFTVSLTSNGTGNNSNTVDNCRVTRTQVGIYSAGNGTANKNTGTVISKNRIDAPGPDNVGRGGILLRYENGPVVTQNVIDGLFWTDDIGAYAISLGLSTITTANFTGDEVTNAVVSRNLIKGVVQTNPDGFTAAGIAVASAASGTTTIVNNMISGIFSYALDPDVCVGILVGGGVGSTTEIYFNSVSMTGNRQDATSPSFCVAIGGSDPAVNLRNNLLINAQTTNGGVGDGYSLGFDYNTPFTRLTSNYNDLVSTSGSPLAVVGGLLNTPAGDISDLASWRTATGRDGNSKSQNPLFLSNGDLHITQSGSPAANAGVVISSVTTDLDGDAGKRTTTPDIGADEFGTQLMNVTVVGSGTVTKNPNQPNYIINAVVQLTATPAANYHFVGWTGDLTGTTNPVNVTMNTDKNITATFALNTFALTVNNAGTGSGAVARNPNQASYNTGTVVSLTATPLAGSQFVSWSGDATGAANPTSVTMTANRTVTATFTLNTYPLNVTTVGNGAVAKSPNQANYNHGSTVTLTATPAAGYQFVGWSGDASGSTNPLAVTMDGAKNITATFALYQYTLTLQTVGDGVVAKNPDLVQFDQGTSVVLTAVPDAGQHFVAWSGDTTGSINPLTVTMNSNKNITATFAINSYTLGVTKVGDGSVAKSPDQPQYDSGTDVTLTATPTAGNTFIGWSGDLTGVTNPIVVDMDDDKVVTATFTVKLNLTSQGNGSVANVPNQPNYAPGTVVQLTATPLAGHTFVGWSGDASGSTNPLSVTLDSTRTITALFTTSLAVTVTGSGSVTKNPNQPTYTAGTTVTLTAVPDVGFNFVSWSGDASGSTNPLPVVMTANKNIDAMFSTNTYTLTVATTGSGSVTKSPDQAAYPHASNVTLTAVPAAGYHFVNWTGDASGSTNPLTLPMDGNKNVTANFAIDNYTLTTAVVGSGTVAKSPDQPTYPAGTPVQLTATPAVGFHFVNWSGDTSGSSNPLSITMNASKNITANFAINTYPLTVLVQGRGAVTPNPVQATYDHGSSVQLTATPDPGFSFVNWSGDATGSTNPVTVVMNGPKTVTASFTSQLTIVVVGNGAVTKNPDLAAYAPGQNVQLSAVPAPGYHLVSWSGDATGSTSPVTVTMGGDKTVTATFAINTYTLSVAVVGPGTITKNPDQATYDHGAAVSLTANVPAGYHLVGWSGGATGTANPLGITMDSDKTITGTFAINTYTLSVSTVGPGTVVKTPDQPTYDHGTTVLLSPAPPTGYSFTGWSGDATGTDIPLSVVMDGNKNVTATFVIQSFTVTTSVTGNGSVAKSPDQPTYNYGVEVTVTATPSAGYHFTGWSGGVSGTNNPLTLVVDGDKDLTANFALNTYALDVSPVGGGSITRIPNQALYDHGTSVQLTAIPTAGYHLIGWGGDASGTTNPLTLIMDSNKTITALFAINTYTLNVTVADSGSVTKSPDQALYDHGTIVTLTANVPVGYHFVNWSGDGSGTSNPLFVTMNGNRNILATFQINTYTIGVSTVGSGTVTKFPSLTQYDHGRDVQLFANPATGWHFVSWGGDAVGSSSPVLVHMDGNKTVTATFQIDQLTLTVAGTGGGSVTKNPNQATYAYGTVVQLTAVPDAGFHHRDWIGDASGTTNPINVTMDRNRDVTARFLSNTFTLSATALGGVATIQKTPNSASYAPGTQVTLTCTPAAGYQMAYWHVVGRADTIPFNPVLCNMDSNVVIEAVLRAGSNPVLTVNVQGGGTVVRDPSQPNYPPGTWVNVLATPATDFRFDHWIVAGAGIATINPIDVFVDRDHYLTAVFVSTLVTLNTPVTQGSGTVQRSPNAAGYQDGTLVQITATPSPGYHFMGWTGDTATTANPITVRMDREKTIAATFGFAANVTVVGPGSVTRSLDQPLYAPGTNLTLTPDPNFGYHFVGWSGDTTGWHSPLTMTMNSDKNLTATFAVDSFYLEILVVGNGSVSKLPNRNFYARGNTVTLTANPDPGWHFVGWENCPVDQTERYPRQGGDDQPTCQNGSQNPMVISIDGARQVLATFDINLSPLTATASTNGDISPAGISQVAYGSNQAFTVRPEPGYRVSDVVVDGRSIGAISSYTFSNVTVPHAIEAKFEPGTQSARVDVVGAGTVAESSSETEGGQVRLTAVPDAGWLFAGWTGDAVAGNGSVEIGRGGHLIATFLEVDDRLTVTAHVPNGGRKLTVGETVLLEWSAERGVELVDLWLSRRGTGGLVETIAVGVPNTGSYAWTVSGPEATDADLRIVARNKAGRAAVDTVSTSIEPVAVVIPSDWALSAPAPNPTVGDAHMEFAVPREARVQIGVHDLQGREVARLVNGIYRPGRYPVSWDGRTDRGLAPAGVYFVRFRAGGKDLVRRLHVSR